MPKKALTRTLSFFLALLMLGLTACSENAAQDTETETTAAAETETAAAAEETIPEETEITRANYPDSLPEQLDFGGADYRILCQETILSKFSQVENEMMVEGLTGEVINDAIYNRAQSVMERTGTNVSAVIVDDTIKTIQSTVAAADPVCEVSAAYAYYVTPLALRGHFINLLKIPHLDLEQPWWPASLSTDLTIDNKLYFVSGDISLKLTQFLYCMFFNKTLANDWNVPDFYDLVREGKWTIDKYIECASMVSSDLDGDGKFTDADLYGTVNSQYTDGRWAAYDLPISTQKEDGSLELCVMSEKYLEMYDKLYQFYNGTNYAYRYVTEAGCDKVFVSDRTLLYPYFLFASEGFREMESDYGIVPYPKFNEEQENYGTLAHDNYSLISVPIYVTPDNFEMVGAVTEAMAAESYRSVTPAYLEIAMKDKFLRDENSADMLEIILGNVKFDPAVVYSNSLGDIMHLSRNIYDKIENIASTYKRRKKVYEKSFEKFNKQYMALED